MRHPLDVLEIWRSIPNFPYEISSWGRVRRTMSGKRTFVGKILKPWPDTQDRLCVTLYLDGNSSVQQVHKLVCNIFHGPKPTLLHEVAHGDGKHRNNRASNLRWATKKENHADAMKHGTHQVFRLNEMRMSL